MTAAPAWVAPWVGRPFALGARGPVAYDCWGLVRAVALAEYSVDLPSWSDYASDADRAELARIAAGGHGGWQEIDEEQARPGDVVELRVLGQPCHVGLVVAQGLMLHTLERTGAVVERWSDIRWQRRVVGFFRHPEIAAAREALRRD